MKIQMKTERLDDVASFYNKEACEYDEGYSSVVCKAEDAIVKEILTPIINGSVLDIGAGNGLFCEMFDIDDYFGIELSGLMTLRAKEKYKSKSFSVADMHSLPFRDDSFDSAVSLYGPPSYSLSPEELMTEVLRVVKPGGYVALMPYTLRVGHELDMGGYSTATEKGIEKIFYTEDMLRELMIDLDGVEVFGINYFLNTQERFSEEMKLPQNLSLEKAIEILRREKIYKGMIPPEFARHIIAIGKKRG